MNSASTGSGGEPFAHLLRFGLARALQAHSEELRAKHTGMTLDLDLVDDEGLLDEAACRVLYRVFIEALSNILRHEGEQGPLRVRVHYAPTGDKRMRLEIRSGAGSFSVREDWARFQRGALGVMGLKPRLEELGGALEIHAPEGEETVIEASVPMD